MSIISELTARAASIGGKVVLPESGDPRMLKAAVQIVREGIAEVVLLGDKTQILKDAKELGLDLSIESKISFVNPQDSPDSPRFAEYFYNRRKEKGVTAPEAMDTIQKPLYFGASMVKHGLVNGMVAGSINTTADVLRAALQVVGVKPGLKTVSSTFIMVVPDFMGADKVFLFADCAVVPNPTDAQLADIAISTAETRRALLGDDPKVALLSFSTKGSASDDLVEKVVAAKKIMEERKVDFDFDGELQLDAAIIPEVAKSKAPGSKIAGQANVLIFPDLQAGNIGYKLVQRMAKAEAIGPIIQGLAFPVCDLSRGCSVQDIVSTAVLVLLMSAQK
ncbi:MAG: phosphate acetyltransferase [Candidatus Cloacimonetes bacterium]|nr:phosphate acetyltransferase [Candidatus Cloacimonadota bacterium]